jgi:membrane-associated phospholipid phosphatase
MHPLLEDKVIDFWRRFVLWASTLRPIIRLGCLTAGLIAFLAFLPQGMRRYLWESLQSHRILAYMLLGFSALAISLVWSAGQDLDTWIFLLFNVRGSHPIWLDRVMVFLTQIGSGLTALGIAFVLFLAGQRLLAYELVLGTLALWLVVELVKFLVQRSRPFIRVAETHIVGYRAIGRSFPSGHTSQVFFMATLMAQRFPGNAWIVFLLYATASMVGITRMYIGAHYPRDVLAGAILGSAWGLLGVIVVGFTQ